MRREAGFRLTFLSGLHKWLEPAPLAHASLAVLVDAQVVGFSAATILVGGAGRIFGLKNFDP